MLSSYFDWRFCKKVAVHGLKLEIRNWGEQYKGMKSKFPISDFNVP